jgi:hypothetical protein
LTAHTVLLNSTAILKARPQCYEWTVTWRQMQRVRATWCIGGRGSECACWACADWQSRHGVWCIVSHCMARLVDEWSLPTTTSHTDSGDLDVTQLQQYRFMRAALAAARSLPVLPAFTQLANGMQDQWSSTPHIYERVSGTWEPIQSRSHEGKMENTRAPGRGSLRLEAWRRRCVLARRD